MHLNDRLPALCDELATHTTIAVQTPGAVVTAFLEDAATLASLATLKSRRRIDRGTLALLHEVFADDATSRRHEQLATVFVPARLLTHLAGPGQAAGWLRELLFGETLKLALGTAQAGADVRLVELLLGRSTLWPELTAPPVWENVFDNEASGVFLDVNWHQGVRWFNAERFAELLQWLFFAAAFDAATVASGRQALLNILAAGYERMEAALAAAQTAGYRVDNFLEIV